MIQSHEENTSSASEMHAQFWAFNPRKAFDEYQVEAHRTAIYPSEQALSYVALGLAGESGEVANKVKKILRDSGGVVSVSQRDALIDELGDVLWYVAELAFVLDIPLSLVALRNLDKLADREDRNMLHGDGDE